jgi:nucleoside-diphosphate-sugar epimerase
VKVLLAGSSSVIAAAIARRIGGFAEVRTAGRSGADYMLDLAQPASLPSIPERFDLVINCAADFGGPSDADALRAEVVNGAGALAVSALAHRTGAKRVLLVSSVSATYRPGDPHYGVYALSKRHGEEAAAFFCAANDLALTILRPTQVYDAEGACRRHQKLLYAIADQAESGEGVRLHGTHDARRNYLFLDDLAEICGRVIHGSVAGTFAVAHPRDVRLGEVAAAAIDAFGKRGRVSFLPGHPDIPDLPASGDLPLYDLIGYRPAVDIGEGMRLIRENRSMPS